MWHILPYEQLLELLEMDEETFAIILREEDSCELNVMAHGAYSLYQSCLNQIRFYRARARQDKRVMLQMTKEEIVCAEKTLAMMKLNAAIGFEAANHYYFSKGQLREKILNCYDIIARLEA